MMSTTNVHENSLAAYHEGRLGDFTKRQQAILATLQEYGALTDRQILINLGFADMNAVRPRITELVEMGVLQEIGSTRCAITKKLVRICRIAPPETEGFLPGFTPAKGGHRDLG